MMTSSHAYWTWRAIRNRPGAGWTVLGAVTPDLPALLAGPVLSRQGSAPDDLLGEIYHRPGLRQVHLAVHSLLAPAAVAALGGRRARHLASGWLGHLAVDYVTHHSDAWPPLWPVSSRRWKSPVSYWEKEHNARAWSVTDAYALATATFMDRTGRTARLAGAGAFVAALGPALVGPGRNLWTALGLSPDPLARDRDLDGPGGGIS